MSFVDLNAVTRNIVRANLTDERTKHMDSCLHYSLAKSIGVSRRLRGLLSRPILELVAQNQRHYFMISITKGALSLSIDRFLFPGGEIGIKLDTNNLRYRYDDSPVQRITARIRSSDDLVALALTRDALERFDPTPIELFMPYVPYARQDRVCVPGEPLSIKVLCSMINAMQFKRVMIVDPHSHVTSSLLDRCHVYSQFDVVSVFPELTVAALDSLLISPDAGANKKTADIAKYFGHQRFVRADKVRNLDTGEILETVVMSDSLEGAHVIIVDDICDGGRTFIELAKALQAKKVATISLFVTHGIFSKGTAVLNKAGISKIYTTNSYYDVWPGGIGAVITLNLDRAFKTT